MDTMIYEIKDANNKKIGERYYLKLSAARRVAKQITGKMKKNNQRGSGIKIVGCELHAIYDSFCEWHFAE